MGRMLGGLLVMWALATAAMAATMPDHDKVPGAKDHPLLSRYAGSVLVAYAAKDYDETDLVAGKYRAGPGNTPFEGVIHLEGKITRIAYNYPPGRSALEVMRNYITAIQSAGLGIDFACEKGSCDDAGGSRFGGAIENLKISQNQEHWTAYADSSPFNYGRLEPHYVLASSPRPGGARIYAAVYVVPPLSGQNGGVLIEIVEPAAMETGKVSVNLTAEQMAKAISSDGKVALYGLYFDTDKSELRSDSKPSLDEIAKLLRQDAKLNVFVVGHTDNQGTFAHNLELSQKRSESIVHSLTADYHIEAARLVPKGVASLAPVAANASEEGRAKNRRVELVSQ